MPTIAGGVIYRSSVMAGRHSLRGGADHSITPQCLVEGDHRPVGPVIVRPLVSRTHDQIVRNSGSAIVRGTGSGPHRRRYTRKRQIGARTVERGDGPMTTNTGVIAASALNDRGRHASQRSDRGKKSTGGARSRD